MMQWLVMPKTAVLTDNAKKEIAKLLEVYVDGVVSTQSIIYSRIRAGHHDKLFEDLDLSIMSAFGKEKTLNHRPVTNKDIAILQEASSRLLDAAHLSTRISTKLAIATLRDQIRIEVIESNRKRISFFNVIDGTIDILMSKLQDCRLYLFPVLLTHETQPFDVELGCLRIGDLKSFRDAHIRQEDNELNEGECDFESKYQEAWDKVEHRAKHLIVITVDGYELSMGEIAARNAAEFFLNLVRLSFSWCSDKNVKILEVNYEPILMPTLVFDNETKPVSRTLSYGGSDILPVRGEDSMEVIKLLSSYSYVTEIIIGIARGASSKSIVLRRIEYASFLIKTAYEQTSVRLALVNFVAALETLACLDDEDSKKKTLANRCSILLKDTSDKEREIIFAAVEQAYDARNAVVHGDAFHERDYYKTLRKLEPCLHLVVLSAIDLLCYIELNYKVNSAKKLRRLMSNYFKRENKLSE